MAKPPSLDVVLHTLRTDKKMAVGLLTDFDMTPKGRTTGNLALDALTGIGGVPQGRVVEFFGKPSSGKTTCALQTLGKVQAAGGRVAFMDYERTLDTGYARALGVDTDTLIYSQPDSFEDGALIFRAMLATGELNAVCFDSVAAMVTQNELDADTGAAKVADRAKMMHQFMRQIKNGLHHTGCTAIFLNHVMDMVDASPMGQKLAARGIKRQTTPGGTALPFYASLRLEFKQIGNLRTSEMDVLSNEKVDVVTQTNVQATAVKNKVGDPFGTTVLRVRYGKGFSNTYTAYQILKDYGVIKSDKQGKHTFDEQTGYTKDEKIHFPISAPMRGDDWIKGEENVLKSIESSPTWEGRLISMARDILVQNGVEKVDGSMYDENGLEKGEGETILSVMESEGLSVDTTTGEIIEGEVVE